MKFFATEKMIKNENKKKIKENLDKIKKMINDYIILQN